MSEYQLSVLQNDFEILTQMRKDYLARLRTYEDESRQNTCKWIIDEIEEMLERVRVKLLAAV